jgi:hypothetical protein
LKVLRLSRRDVSPRLSLGWGYGPTTMHTSSGPLPHLATLHKLTDVIYPSLHPYTHSSSAAHISVYFLLTLDYTLIVTFNFPSSPFVLRPTHRPSICDLEVQLYCSPPLVWPWRSR